MVTSETVTAPVTQGRAGTRPAFGRAVTVEALAASLVLAVFAFVVVPGTGGRDRSALLLGLGSTTAAVVATRAWRFLDARVTALLATLTAAALLVCVFSPTGGAGFRDAASYGYAATTFAFVAAMCRSALRRNTFAVVICLLGLSQFSSAFLPWWGGEDPSRLMLGTFAWHNQFGAYLLAAALLAATLAVLAAKPLRLIGLLLAPVFGSAVLFSGSRANVLLLIGGWLALGLAAAIARSGRIGALMRWVVIAVALVATSAALTSPVVFPAQGGGAALGAVDKRNNSEQTVEQNLGFRIDHFQAAGAVFADHPLTGAGFGMYAPSAAPHLPFGLTRSPYVHSGFLQAAADGGVLLVAPLFLAMAAIAFVVVSKARRKLRDLRTSPVRVACVLAGAALIAHAAIDIDWTYPALAAMTAALLAAGVGGGAGITPTKTSERRRLIAGISLAACSLVAVAGLGRWQHVDSVLRMRVPGESTDGMASRLLREDRILLGDSRLVTRAVQLAVPPDFGGTLGVSASTADVALRHTSSLGMRNSVVQMQRAQLLMGLGRADEALALSGDVLARDAVPRPFLAAEHAENLAAGGRGVEAVALLTDAIADKRLDRERNADQLASLSRTLRLLAPPPHDARVTCTLWSAQLRISTANPTVPPPPSPVPTGCPGAAATVTALPTPSR